MKFIELTDLQGCTLLLRKSRVTFVSEKIKYEDEVECRVVRLKKSPAILVKETLEQIREKLDQ
jgi:hypothetical protein